MNQSINTDSKNSKEPQQKYRLGTVSIKILGGLNRFYRRLTSPSASIMAQNIQLIEKWLQTTPEDWNNKSWKTEMDFYGLLNNIFLSRNCDLPIRYLPIH